MFGTLPYLFIDAVIIEDQARKSLNDTHEIVVLVNITFYKQFVELARIVPAQSVIVCKYKFSHVCKEVDNTIDVTANFYLIQLNHFAIIHGNQ